MNELVSHSGNISPGNIGIFASYFLWNLLGSFANNFEASNKCSFEIFVSNKPFIGKILGSV